MKLLGHHVNTAALIHEVEQHPAIWNTAVEEYEDIVERKNAWLAVIMKFIPQFNNKPLAEKNETVAVIRKKWKAIRSCYARELQKKRKENSGSGARRRRQYIYFEDLSFLGTVSKQTTSRMNEEVETDASLENEENYEMGLEVQKEDKKAKKINYNQSTKKTHEDDALTQVLENTEDLIHEVEKHPVIWNTAMKENKNKFERRNAWRAPF
ncbi:hypothetical protein GWK47_041659 [Chionoecetes opilio]|uniref:MADF domain-containing protein n=1 Tax=Chionoecetes opilio TaxID=41210 RepID=A0A8J4YIC2_CHIOP|nr:hypothetical protein GWK47_041659 [Chionoecetes opilio]